MAVSKFGFSGFCVDNLANPRRLLSGQSSSCGYAATDTRNISRKSRKEKSDSELGALGVPSTRLRAGLAGANRLSFVLFVVTHCPH